MFLCVGQVDVMRFGELFICVGLIVLSPILFHSSFSLVDSCVSAHPNISVRYNDRPIAICDQISCRAMENCTFIARRAMDFVVRMPTCLGAHNSVIFKPTEKYNISKLMYFSR